METMLPLTIKIMVDKRSKDAPFIAYTPELDVVSCGPTEEKARKNLHEAVKITMEEIENKGQLTEFLIHYRKLAKVFEKKAIPQTVDR